jgi:hypothetical protein
MERYASRFATKDTSFQRIQAAQTAFSQKGNALLLLARWKHHQ